MRAFCGWDNALCPLSRLFPEFTVELLPAPLLLGQGPRRPSSSQWNVSGSEASYPSLEPQKHHMCSASPYFSSEETEECLAPRMEGVMSTEQRSHPACTAFCSEGEESLGCEESLRSGVICCSTSQLRLVNTPPGSSGGVQGGQGAWGSKEILWAGLCQTWRIGSASFRTEGLGTDSVLDTLGSHRHFSWDL